MTSKKKINNLIKKLIDYTLSYEFKIIVMILLFCFTITSFTAMSLTKIHFKEKDETLQNIQAQYEKLNEKYKTLQEQYNVLQSWERELRDLYHECQENGTWYEQFYKDHVDTYTGEVRGEYYE